jgi:hypothetical protein
MWMMHPVPFCVRLAWLNSVSRKAKKIPWDCSLMILVRGVFCLIVLYIAIIMIMWIVLRNNELNFTLQFMILLPKTATSTSLTFSKTPIRDSTRKGWIHPKSFLQCIRELRWGKTSGYQSWALYFAELALEVICTIVRKCPSVNCGSDVHISYRDLTWISRHSPLCLGYRMQHKGLTCSVSMLQWNICYNILSLHIFFLAACYQIYI